MTIYNACHVATRAVVMAMMVLTSVLSDSFVRAADAPADSAKQYDDVVSKGVQFLASSQADDGSYSASAGPGVTALATSALLRHGRSPLDPVVAKSLKYLESFVHNDGGIYKEGSNHENYETCLALVCFSDANKSGRYDALVKNAERYIKGAQWSGEKSEMQFGGAGYGRSKRPDLSNTQFFLDALKASGAAADSEAVQNALIFVSRCQNLESEHNTAPFATKNPDGGFYYTVAGEGASMAGKSDEGGLRSYGSMTYAGLKSMIFAGVDKNDPRVKAATAWLQKHYDLKSNPGMGDVGLYYYYHTFAKALAAVGDESFTDAEGKKHLWREELLAELAARQQANGSWVNANPRWLEGDANIVSAYALLALSYAKPAK